jgi:CRP-like cAMP-binding protein
MSILYSPKQNQILAALPVQEYTRLLPFLELVDLPLGHVIYEPNSRINQLYFPTTCIIARMYELESGISRQVSMVGNEGVTGMFLLLGCDRTPATVIVQSPGHGYRIKSNVLKKEFELGGTLQQLLLRFSQALLLQTEQCAVEHRQTIEQQLCRFLLMSLDRLPGDSLPMTHEMVASMLGVRRESVTQAAQTLQAVGAIQYRRGHITVVNRKLMEDRVSDGYEVLKKEYNRLLPKTPASQVPNFHGTMTPSRTGSGRSITIPTPFT